MSDRQQRRLAALRARVAYEDSNPSDCAGSRREGAIARKLVQDLADGLPQTGQAPPRRRLTPRSSRDVVAAMSRRMAGGNTSDDFDTLGGLCPVD